MADNLWFFDHFHPENGGEEAEARSYKNDFEAKMVVGLARHLVRQGYAPEQIAVLTPYLYFSPFIKLIMSIFT
jgi:hypothetical protein